MAMGILAEVERVQAEDRRRRERERRIDAMVGEFVRRAQNEGLTADESVLLVARFAAAIEAADAHPSPGAQTVTLLVDEKFAGGTRKDRAQALLSSASNGLTVGEIATELYGATDGAARHKARSVLDYLARTDAAHAVDGRWYRGPAPEKTSKREGSAKGAPSATPLARRVLDQANRPLTIREIVAAVLGLNKQIPKPHIYSALYKMQRRKEIIKDGDKYALNPDRGVAA